MLRNRVVFISTKNKNQLCLNLTFYCLAANGFRETRSMTVLCKHIKPVGHGRLKIANECSMCFIFTLVNNTISWISAILTIRSINSKILWIAAI